MRGSPAGEGRGKAEALGLRAPEAAGKIVLITYTSGQYKGQTHRMRLVRFVENCGCCTEMWCDAYML